MFYTSLSIASTYLLPIIFMILCYLVLRIVYCISLVRKEAMKNTLTLVYNFFLGGLIFSSAACVQGAFLNPIDKIFTLSSCFYLLGLLIFAIVLIESCWSTYRARQNIFKFRILVKAVLLSIIHYNGVQLLALVLCFEAFFMVLTLRLLKI